MAAEGRPGMAYRGCGMSAGGTAGPVFCYSVGGGRQYATAPL